MKRYKTILSVFALISAGLITGYAKTDITEDDWGDDDKPGNVTVELVSAPKAVYADLHLSLSSSDKDATLMWTCREGIAPEEEGWEVYKAPLYLTEDCKVRYYATRKKGVRSEVKTYSFIYADHQAPSPVLSANDDGSHLVMSCTLPDAQVRYTADGSEPSEHSDLYSSPVEITSYLYRARTFAKGYFPSETVDYTAASISLVAPVPSARFEDKHLYLQSAGSGVEIYYSFNSDADINDAKEWTKYTSPLGLTENCIVRFFSRKADYKDSDVQSFTFILSNYRAADPTIERNDAGTHIVMETATEGGEIRYTTDDSEPTEKSPLYTEPILIEGNGTFTAKTFAKGLFESKANRYVVANMAVPVPFAQFGKKRFYLLCLDPKAEIRYTTNPEATAADLSLWEVYKAPFSLTGDCTLRFFTRRENFNDSDMESLTVAYADYQCKAPSLNRNELGTHIVMEATPIDPPSGFMPDDDSVPVLEAPQIRYTVDGSEPTEKSALYEAPVRITPGAVYRARVFDTNYYASEITEYAIGNSTLPVPTAEFHNFTLRLTCSDSDAGIWYTTNPDATLDNLADWKLYVGPISLEGDCTYRFFSGDDDDNASDIQSFVFQKADYTVIAPIIERSEDGTRVEMETVTPEADIYYTTDGTIPTEDSFLYTEPVVITGNTTFIAKAFLDGYYDSEITEFVVNNMAVPVAYATVVNKCLELNCSDSLADIWYTTDVMALPDNLADWTHYSAPISLSENATFHFFTRREGFNDSDIETFVFLKANHQVATPSIDRSEDSLYVVMTCDTEGADIRYTTDGSEPSAESALYTEPVFVEGNCTYAAKAFASGLFDSAMTQYTVSSMVVMEPYAVFENTMLTLSIGDSEAEIWYSVNDGKTLRSTEEWKLYKEPIRFKGDCTVRYFGRRQGYNDSEIKTFELIYADYQPAAPEIIVSEEGNKAEIKSDVENGVIRYTFGSEDVADPDEDSPVYNGPIVFKDGHNIIKARIYVDGMFPSDVKVLSYDYEKDPTSVESVKTVDGLLFTVRNGSRGFVASAASLLPVYNAQGVCVTVMHLNAGFNALPELEPGIYFIGGIKILF